MSHVFSDAEALFEDEVLLPVQYSEPSKGRLLSPEHRLLWAVLEDAVGCWQANETATGGERRRVFQEAAEWFESDADDSPFAFVVICQLFGLEPEWIRRGLQRWSERRRQQPGSVAPLCVRRMNGSRHAIGRATSRRRAAA